LYLVRRAREDTGGANAAQERKRLVSPPQLATIDACRT